MLAKGVLGSHWLLLLHEAIVNMSLKHSKLKNRKADVNVNAGIILGMVSANEKRCYFVTPSVGGWAYTQNGPQATGLDA